MDHDYSVGVTQTYVDSAWKVTGTITVTNPNTYAVTNVAVVDTINNGGVCTVSGQASLLIASIAANGNSGPLGYECTYAAAPSPASGVNTATATWDKSANYTPTGSASGTAPAVFGGPTTEVLPVVTVDDDNLVGENWSANRADASWDYTKEFACSTDLADYTDGEYSYTVVNTATINETGADATGDGHGQLLDGRGQQDRHGHLRRAPRVGRREDRRPGLPGPVRRRRRRLHLDGRRDRGVLRREVPGRGLHLGPQPEHRGGDDRHGDRHAGRRHRRDDHVVHRRHVDRAEHPGRAGRQDRVVRLHRSPTTKAATKNTVTVTVGGVTSTADAPVSWETNVIRGEVTLDDNQNPDLPDTLTEGGTWIYQDFETCSTDSEDYGSDGTYFITDENTAVISDGDEELDSSTTTTVVNCFAPVVSKTAVEDFTRTWNWEIVKEKDATYDLVAGDAVTHEYDVDGHPDAGGRLLDG